MLTALALCPQPLQAQRMSTEEYIDTYKEMAVIEMIRSGIPASITLAQGILESGSGNSRLAREANNHFGIKCHKEWTGPSIRLDDDAPNECFRKYESPEMSFRDHTDFLRTRERYAFLFELDPTDYKAWARGLKKAGYATNPKYADILIDLIERYELYRYDYGLSGGNILVENDSTVLNGLTHHIFEVNRIKTVYLLPGENLERIGRLFDIRLKRLKKYNDITDGTPLYTGMHVFLQPKRRRGPVKTHRVLPGETMYQISQEYGIRLKFLYRRNHMEPGTEPAAGEVLYLRGSNPREVRLRPPGTAPKLPAPPEAADTLPAPENSAPDTAAGQPLPTPDSAAPVVDSAMIFLPRDTVPDKAAQPQMELMQDPVASGSLHPDAVKYVYYTVRPKDTLYGISRQFRTTVKQLKEWNHLESDHIEIGQQLIVGIDN